jgi:PhzF family phenazine biosynthesis protein
MSMNIHVKQIDAFTDTPLNGNPAGVVIEAGGLTDRQMQQIAREMAASETAFILPATTPAASLRIRWFTPEVEVPLCGHATIASFHALAEEGLFGMGGPGTYPFQLECRSGILPVKVEKKADGTIVFFGLPVPEFVRAGQYKLDVMRLLNIQLEEFDNHMPMVVAENLFVPVRRLHTIFAMKPNFFAMAQFLTNRNIGGICVFTTETIEHASAVHSRFFAPTAGIAEDPVTGSANGPLGVYLFERGRIDDPGPTITLVGEQGDVIGRKGRVLIRLTVEGDRVNASEVGGRAVTVLDAQLRIV